LLIKYIKSVLWKVAKCLSYIEEARCLKVNFARVLKNANQYIFVLTFVVEFVVNVDYEHAQPQCTC